MQKVATTLSDLQVHRLKEDGVYFVGGVVGLALRIKNFQKTFFFRYTSPVTKTRREITIGSYSVCSLKRVAIKRLNIECKLAKGLILCCCVKKLCKDKKKEPFVKNERQLLYLN